MAPGPSIDAVMRQAGSFRSIEGVRRVLSVVLVTRPPAGWPSRRGTPTRPRARTASRAAVGCRPPGGAAPRRRS